MKKIPNPRDKIRIFSTTTQKKITRAIRNTQVITHIIMVESKSYLSQIMEQIYLRVIRLRENTNGRSKNTILKNQEPPVLFDNVFLSQV